MLRSENTDLANQIVMPRWSHNQSWPKKGMLLEEHDQSWPKKGMLLEKNTQSWPKLVMLLFYGR